MNIYQLIWYKILYQTHDKESKIIWASFGWTVTERGFAPCPVYISHSVQSVFQTYISFLIKTLAIWIAFGSLQRSAVDSGYSYKFSVRAVNINLILFCEISFIYCIKWVYNEYTLDSMHVNIFNMRHFECYKTDSLPD